MKVVITDWGFPSLDIERRIFAEHAIVVEEHQCKTEDDVVAVVASANVVMTQWAPVKAKAIAAMRSCKGIVRYGIGLDNIDMAAARQHGIPVRNVPDYCLNEVADHTMALLLSLQRQITHTQTLVRRGVWSIVPPQELAALRTCTLGLVGFGRIARLVALRAQSFGLKIRAYDPYIADDFFSARHVEKTDFSELLRSADIFSLHLPLTPETQHLLNAKTFSMMKRNTLVINASRGGLIDTAALCEALEKKNIAGAALDVIEEEPLMPGHPLLQFDNVIVTSHTAWYSSSSVGELQRLAALAAVDFLLK
ncbi:MAG: C-terminal binding protein [Bacteroidota bacterium]|nr:C-terminal binding protein [Bacteroidota bacterium]